MQNLHEAIAIEKETIRKYKPEIIEVPRYISDNLKHEFFDWQRSAFENLLVYEADHKQLPTHLIFNMATGTGKTLLMAATMLYYYQQGYRYFLFFVNQNNIVDKTENNFIDSTHTKYLFTEKIIIDDQTVNIKKVNTFSDHPQGIEIKFTSIQQLYNDVHLQRENQTTLVDLHSKNIVMLADEAHHLNTETKKKQSELDLHAQFTDKTSEWEIERRGWEHTVMELILNKRGYGTQQENKNVLLEFTATIPGEESVVQKYADKIIYKFGLKEFLQAGYTKEINLISSTLEKKERVLQALLFQWYRHKIALKHGLVNFKPVILFRSKTIPESEADYEEFLNWVTDISGNDFDFLKKVVAEIAHSQSIHEQGRSRTEQVLQYAKTKKNGFAEAADWIKHNYQAKSVILTNSKTNKTQTEKTDEETDKRLNSLEDHDNHTRAIFTVNRLTEGWDVLNLFDIVRLYKDRDEGKGKAGKRKSESPTTKEKQLIGRGVRYFPFTYADKIKNKRKFDDDLNNELRVLEELYFYSTSDHGYINELKHELKQDGYIRDDRTIKTFSLKKEFQDSDFYKKTKIWHNKQIDNPNRRKNSLNNMKGSFNFDYRVQGLEFHEEEVRLEEQEKDIEKINLQEEGSRTISIKFKDIEKHIFLKAINIKANQENSLFQFEKLTKELELESIEDLQKENLLGGFPITIKVSKNIHRYEDIPHKEKLKLALKFLDRFAADLKETIAPKIGSDFQAGDLETFFSEPKTKIISQEQSSEIPVERLDWYVLDSSFGTSEESGLLQFIKEHIGNLESKYGEIYLLRNEEVYKIYDFEKGRGFQPDFILFLKTLDAKLRYQIFIEAKGNQFIGNDGIFKSGKEGWKEQFLEEISQKYGHGEIIKAENQNYILIGLPFFNEKHRTNFKQQYDDATRLPPK